jgi:hypothetical protein
MKQANFKGFGASSAMLVRQAVAPVEMPDEVVTLCRSEADAVTHSINFACARYGCTQMDIARLCGWAGDSYLSEIKRGRKAMPEKRHLPFVQATGCALLTQYQRRQQIADRMAGKETANERNRAVLARMLQVAA